jgi:HxlR-like helix-turn-helix protein
LGGAADLPRGLRSGLVGRGGSGRSWVRPFLEGRATSQRLNGLAEDGILERLPDPGHAGRNLYQLTQAGRDLWPALHALLMWGKRHRQVNALLFKHAACGTTVDDSGACPTCGVAPTPQDIFTEPRRQTKRDDPVAMTLRRPHRLLEPIQVGDGS